MKNKEMVELYDALSILNKYRNFFHSSNDAKEVKISNIIDRFLPQLHREIVEDELAWIVMEKIRRNKRIEKWIKTK